MKYLLTTKDNSKATRETIKMFETVEGVEIRKIDEKKLKAKGIKTEEIIE